MAGNRQRIMNKLKHHGSWAASTTLEWYPTDTQELYEQNLKDPEKKQQLEKFGWIDTDITYINNSHGFRAPEFELLENFITVGCSFTYGIGLPQQCAWPQILSQKIGIPVYNLGVPGGSLDTCYRVIKHYVPLLKPKFVVMLQPEITRLEIFIKNNPIIYSPKYLDPHTFGQDNWIKHWYSYTENLDTLAQKNIDAIAYVCKAHSVDFYLYQDYYVYGGPKSFLKEIGLSIARDLKHPGTVFNQRLATLIDQDIKNNNTYE